MPETSQGVTGKDYQDVVKAENRSLAVDELLKKLTGELKETRAKQDEMQVKLDETLVKLDKTTELLDKTRHGLDSVQNDGTSVLTQIMELERN
jgi:uncharacterized membrane protein